MIATLTQTINTYFNLFVKNGFYIPIVSYVLYKNTNDLFLSSIIGLKLFPANYFYWFYNSFDYFPEPYERYNQVKQFVRFTDTGHMLSFIYYFYPRIFPVAFNIHFIITLGYWYGIIVVNMKDTSEIIHPDYIVWFNNLWAYAIHILPISLFLREIYIQDVCYQYFSTNDLYYSFLWAYTWIFSIYIPWRYYTKDPIYSILSDDEPFVNKCKIFIIMNGLILVANYCGYYLIHTIC
jgi:hypothetical protein